MSKSSKDYVYDNLDVFDHVPEYLRNKLNSSFSRNLFDKFLTKEEAIPVYGIAGSKSVNDTDTRPILSQTNTERKINTLIPLIYAKSGVEENVFSFSDVINKAKLLGINVAEFSDWGSCQSFNFAPPIDIDKFINFSSYYWYGQTTGSQFVPAWNTSLDPEYYVIARPDFDSHDKFPAEISNDAVETNVTLTGSGYINENFIVTFVNSTHFTVVGETSHLGQADVANGVTYPVDKIFGVDDNGNRTCPYLTFLIKSSSVPFVAGDKFSIYVEHLTDRYSYTFTAANGVTSGKGGISGISGADNYQQVGGFTVREGQRILIQGQNDVSKNGIYIVKAGAWEVAEDYRPENLVNGAAVYVSNGQAKGLWERNPDNTFTFMGARKNVSDWSEFNFWIHAEDAEAIGLDVNKIVQARRPIIEYDFGLELNNESYNGKPSVGRSLFNAEQKKIKFNQLPLFNLYLANGEFAELVSPIFFYEESQTSPVDSALLRRIKQNQNKDFIFSQGCINSDGSILLFKRSGVLKTIWAPGVTEAQASTRVLSSEKRQLTDVEANVSIQNLYAKIRNAKWHLAAITADTFVISSPQYPEVNVMIGLDATTDITDSIGNTLFSITIHSGSTTIPAEGVTIGDTIHFKTVNKERARFVNGETLGTAIDVPVDSEMENGVWTTPFQLEYNCYHENRQSIIFGDLISHFKSVIENQPGFSGSSFGKNNFRNIPNKNLGLGGKIKEHNSELAKFIGLVNQENISPISIIDFAETQYAQAINSVNEYVNKYASEFLSKHGTPSFIGDNEVTSLIPTLVDEYCDYYGQRVDIDTYFSDSTSPIPNWPVTMPALGLAYATQPQYGFDQDLGIDVIVHHDAHLTPKNQRNVEFDRGLTKISVERSDDTSTPGIFSSTMPANPYKNQFWFNSTTGVLKLFNVISDLSTAPASANEGDFWYNRNTNTLFAYVAGSWVVQADRSAAWKTVETHKILNAFILEIETRIFNSLNPNQIIVYPPALNEERNASLEFEFAKFAAKYGYDPLAPDYDVANPFSWNYSVTDFPVIGTGHARWYDIYKEYFSAATGTPFKTCRPNLEPWKLLGYEVKPLGFDDTYAGVSQVDPGLKLMDVSVVLFGELADVQAAPQEVDGRTLSVGDRVLVTNGQNAGIYSVTVVGTGSNGQWTFSADFNPHAITNGEHVTAKYGSAWAGTTWFVINAGTMVEFEQVRTWKLQLWADIQNAFPTLKLCVNIFNEELLPPYVDPLSAAAQFAMTNSVPSSAADPYTFGQNGPTELVWTKSLEYSYSLIRSSLKNQPLAFIEATWGDAKRTVNELTIDKHISRKTSHKEAILHGEQLPVVNRARIVYSSALPVTGGEKSVVLTCDLVRDGFDSFKIEVDGVFAGYLNSFDPACGIDFSGFLMTDEGKGFQIGDKISFNVAATGEISNVVFTQATKKVLQGIGQLYTQLMKYNSYSLTTSKNNTLFRGWDVLLGYRFGSFMNTDTLRLSSVFDIPLGMCNLITKISPYSSSSWINAIRIQLVKVGTTVLDNGIYKPANQGEDWVFRIENYFDRHPAIHYYDVDTAEKFFLYDTFTTDVTKIEVKCYDGSLEESLLSEYRISSRIGNFIQLSYTEYKRFHDGSIIYDELGNPVVKKVHTANVVIVSNESLFDTQYPERYCVAKTPAAYLTFKALELRRSPEIWKNYTTNLSVKTATTPFLIAGIQNVVNFLFGYTRYLEDSGWRINQNEVPDIDEETGRIVTWQLEIEKFIDAVYDNMNAGQGTIINPFMANLWFNAPQGLVSKFETIKFLDVSASQFTFDILGGQIPVEQLKIVREEDTTSISSDTPMFGAHVNVEFYEHCVLFPYYLDNAKKQKLIFDPFLGMKLSKILVDGSRQAVQSARPSFGGFYLNNNQMKRNIVSSIEDLGKIYDSEAAFNNPTISKYALSLFGFSNKDYFDKLGTSKKNQFNFWRGMIQAKGTNSSVDAFLNNTAYEDAKIDEYWAFKVAEYGDARPKSFPEMKLKVADCLLDNARFQFGTGIASLPSFNGVLETDEDRWVNLDDLEELKDPNKPGMYFDAESVGIYQVGSNILDITPEIGNLVQKVNGVVSSHLVRFVDEAQKVKKLNTTYNKIRVIMRGGEKSADPAINPAGAFADDPIIENFDVYKVLLNGDQLLVENQANVNGTYGILNETFKCDDFEFQLTTDYIQMTYRPAVTNPSAPGFGVGPNQNSYVFEFSLITDFYNEDTDTFTVSRFVKLPFVADKIIFDSQYAKQISANVLQLKKAQAFTVEGFGPQKPKFSPIKLFDYKSDTFIGNIPYWNPALGQHTPEAYEIINMVSVADPAKYNQTTQELNNPNYDVLKPWGSKEVGKVWWNTKNLDYIPYYDPVFYPDMENRLSKWGALAEYSNVEVYEWVESDVPPEEYNARVLSDAKNQNVPQSEKKSGEVAKTNLLTRSRTWNVRPIAWKKNEKTGDSAFFTSSLFNKVRISSETVGESTMILNYGRFSDFSITSGMSMSAWDTINDVPVGQATLTGTLDYRIGTEAEIMSVPGVVQSSNSNVTGITVSSSNKSSSAGKAVGKIKMSSYEEDGIYYVRATEINTGKSQSLPVADVNSGTSFVDYDFTELGFKFRLSLA